MDTYHVAENIEHIRAVANGGQAWEAGLEELAKLFEQWAKRDAKLSTNSYSAPESIALAAQCGTWFEASKYLRKFIDESRPLPEDFHPGVTVRLEDYGRVVIGEGPDVVDGNALLFTGQEQGFEHPNADEDAAHDAEVRGL